ncbi:hypothetical protein GCK32_006522 [Trichostrongylus colubriformis]|uniref:Chromo domain-containing protein n=1 Tax=Trichostrongylus colubriformis TaxID=6319 RepID=A0AAN8FLX6_TRICO
MIIECLFHTYNEFEISLNHLHWIWVREILATRIKRGRREYLIKWEVCSYEEVTWEAEADCCITKSPADCSEQVQVPVKQSHHILMPAEGVANHVVAA